MTTAAHRVSPYRRREKLAELRRQAGIPGLVPTANLAPHVRQLLAGGWTKEDLAAETGVSSRAIRYILNGQPTVQLPTARALLAIRPDSTPMVDATASVRRIQALACVGWSITWTAEQIDRCPAALHKILSGTKPDFRRDSARRLEQLYLAHADKPGPGVYTQAVAERNGWAPPVTWDDDTIADPDAHPNWTGYCGTDRGWWTHRLERLTMCDPCQTAHDEFSASIRHLPKAERFKASGKAQAAARNREADLAHDAREVMRVCGLDYDLTAERLGVTKPYLLQVLRRYPEPAQAA